MAGKNKAQLTEELTALGVTEEEMKGKTNAELQAMVDEVKANAEATEEPVEETKDEEDTDILVEESEDEEPAEEPIVEYEMQMGIHEPKVIKVHPLAKRVVIANISEGEVLATTNPTGKFEKGDKIAPGESKEFTEPRAIVVRSASRPVIKVSQYVK